MPVNAAAEKSRLRRLLEEAYAQGLTEEAASYEQKLKDIEAKGARSGDQRSDGMSNLNKRNKQTNFDIALKNVSNKPAGTVESKGGVDVFSRRATRPSIYWNTSSSAKNDKEKEKVACQKSQQSAKLSVRQMKMDPAELIKQLDMEIDLSLIDPSVASAAPSEDPQVVVKRLLGRKWYSSIVDDKAEADDCPILTYEDYLIDAANNPS